MFHCRALGGLLIVGALCARAQAAPATEKAATVKCTATVARGRLMVRYRFENTTGEDVYVVDHFRPAAAYVLRNYDAVLIARKVLRPPPFLRRAAPKVPPVRRVAAGEVVTGTLRMPWPLVEDHPFRMGRKPLQVELDRVQCALGYFPVRAEVPLMSVKIDGKPALVPSEVEALRAQRVAKSAYLDLPPN